MYICPICNREFFNDTAVAKHSLVCWREHNPNHKSKPAPRSEDIIAKEVENGVLDFFMSFQKEK